MFFLTKKKKRQLSYPNLKFCFLIRYFEAIFSNPIVLNFFKTVTKKNKFYTKKVKNTSKEYQSLSNCGSSILFSTYSYFLFLYIFSFNHIIVLEKYSLL